MSHKKIISVTITFGSIIILFLLRNLPAIEQLRGMTVRLFSPIMRGRELTMFLHESEEKAQNEDYIHTLEFAIASLRMENDTLKQALSLEDHRQVRLTGFPVLTYTRDRTKEYLLIDIGKNTESVHEGTILVTQNGAIVGKVKEISGSVAKIAVGSDPDEVFDASTVSGMRVLAKGIGARTFNLELISAESPLKVNEFVGLWTGSSSEPLPLAKVVRLKEGESKAFQGGTAVLLARPELLREVFVMNQTRK